MTNPHCGSERGLLITYAVVYCTWPCIVAMLYGLYLVFGVEDRTMNWMGQMSFLFFIQPLSLSQRPEWKAPCRRLDLFLAAVLGGIIGLLLKLSFAHEQSLVWQSPSQILLPGFFAVGWYAGYTQILTARLAHGAAVEDQLVTTK